VVDPRKIRLIAESTLKCDKVDAEILARLSRFDPELLQPVYQRSYAAQELRTRLKVRQSLVRSRAKLIIEHESQQRHECHRWWKAPRRKLGRPAESQVFVRLSIAPASQVAGHLEMLSSPGAGWRGTAGPVRASPESPVARSNESTSRTESLQLVQRRGGPRGAEKGASLCCARERVE